MPDRASTTITEHPWRSPVEVLSSFAEEPFVFALISGDDGWSYLGRRPAETYAAAQGEAGAAALRGLVKAPSPPGESLSRPPFAGGVVGLASYEFGAAAEPTLRLARTGWSDLVAARYDAILAFDMAARRVFAVGRGELSDVRAWEAGGWLNGLALPGLAEPPAASFEDRTGSEAYQAAVAKVVAAIERGDLFQANIARRWVGLLKPSARPFDVFRRLAAGSAAPFAAYLRLPGRAVVSNSPERFLQVSAEGVVRAQPIKGTRPRGLTPAADKALAAELLASAKDRAENRMIVDLMRNDLSRACIPGSVSVEAEFALESYANVHHLVSTVTGRLASGCDALELFTSAFPPGSVTGAPKVQAMIEIARHEPPRGPYCGSMFWAGADGAFDSSVLIRTVAFEEDGGGWRFEARAGAGITADSDPQTEADEAETKIDAIRRALTQ